ncbi:matrixin family metalloprotease [Rhodobacteraceae bacterium R_SAG9]|nr:matrixin family metalloprotease [Rhodobacteraceae bacterium R_SAG9]
MSISQNEKSFERSDTTGRVVAAFRANDSSNGDGVQVSTQLSGNVSGAEPNIQNMEDAAETEVSLLEQIDPDNQSQTADVNDGDDTAKNDESEAGTVLAAAEAPQNHSVEDASSNSTDAYGPHKVQDNVTEILEKLMKQAESAKLDGAFESPIPTNEMASFEGPPPPHEYEESGCACACCLDIGPGNGPDSTALGNIGAPAAATTLDNLARYLSEYNHGNTAGSDFWDDFWPADGEGPNYHWNLTNSGLNAQNGVITFNLGANNYDSNGLTDDGADSASRMDAIRHAFNVYEDILGINFVETTNMAADINFGNENSGAFANFNADGKNSNEGATGSISNAWINIATGWSGTGVIGDYYFHTALHEIGHALGLGHQGNYNAGQGSLTYGAQAQWQNDTIQYTMMSYWAQSNFTAPGENTPSGSFLGDVNIIGPQVVDWLALNRMYDPMGYGIDDGTTGSNTTWGFNSTWVDWTPTTTGPVEGYANTAFASMDTLLATSTMTIVDAGGIDTLDLSGFSNNTKIDVSTVSASDTAPSFSNVAGLNGNLMIGVGTVIENVVGGAGAEEIIGNSSANNLKGNGGNDTIRGESGADTLIGDAGNDVLLGGSGSDSLLGGNDNDSLVGGGYFDTLLGGAGNDTLEGGFATDSVNGGSGNDLIRVLAGEYYDSVDGGTGNDTLDHSDSTYSGDVFNFATQLITGTHINGTSATLRNIETYRDGSGANTIHSDGSGLFDGNGGNDTIHAGSGTAETLDGGSGVDQLNTTHWNGDYDIDLDTGVTNYSGESFVNFENVISGGGDDNLLGTSGANSIEGGDGNDTLNGRAGHDTLRGDGGNDTLVYSRSSTYSSDVDTFDGGAGVDTFFVSNASLTSGRTVNLSTGQFLFGASSVRGNLISIENVTVNNATNVVGDNNANVIIGTGVFANSFDGGGGNDLIDGGSGNDTILGGSGNDTLIGGVGVDSYDGGVGTDILDLSDSAAGWIIDGTGAGTSGGNSFTSSNIEQIIGSDFDDSISENTAPPNNSIIDVINAGAGNDTVIANSGASASDNFDGGSGIDLLDLSAHTVGRNLDLGAGTLSGHGSATNFENAIGGSGNDTITGTSGANNIDGGEGSNELSGLGGDDTLLGGSSADTLLGGGGSDSLVGNDGDDNISGGGDNDTIFGGSGLDTINGDTGKDVISGNNGADFIKGNNGSDTIFGGNGNDTLAGNNGDDKLDGNGGDDLLSGGDGKDRLFGGGGEDTLNAGGGKDKLYGGNKDDILNGQGGDDLLVGGTGNDTLIGGDGNDTMYGDDGSDVFVFQSGFGTDVIHNFRANNAEDIDLSSVGAITSFADLLANHLVDDGGTAKIVAGANSILLVGVAFSDVGVGLDYSAADFIF